MFHVKQGRQKPEHTNLQNDPMDQKIALLFQGHRFYHFRHIYDRKSRLSTVRAAIPLS